MRDLRRVVRVWKATAEENRQRRHRCRYWDERMREKGRMEERRERLRAEGMARYARRVRRANRLIVGGIVTLVAGYIAWMVETDQPAGAYLLWAGLILFNLAVFMGWLPESPQAWLSPRMEE